MTATTTKAKAQNKVDVAGITEAAAAEVHETLSTIDTDVNLLTESAKIVNANEAVITELASYRDKLILSLVFYGGRSALSASNMGGVSRTLVTRLIEEQVGGGQVFHLKGKSAEELAAAGKAARLAKRSTAESELPGVAEKIVDARARANAAREYRDAATHRLVEAGTMSKAEIARAIGTNHSSVAHILYRSKTAKGDL